MDILTEMQIAEAIGRLEHAIKQQKNLNKEDIWNDVKKAISVLQKAAKDLKPYNLRA
jgi:hypothetical protein